MEKIDRLISRLSTRGKGIMALDESPRSMGRRFERLGIPNDTERRLKFFSMIFGTEDLQEKISGVILYDDLLNDDEKTTVIRKCALDQDLILGVRMDKGITALPGHSGQGYTIGLDDLNSRLDVAICRQCGFVKWRAAFRASPKDRVAFRANAMALALFASAAHERGLAPIVEAEIEMDGAHSAAECAETLQAVLACIFETLSDFHVDGGRVILKTNFVVPGKTSSDILEVAHVGDATERVLRAAVPDIVPLIAFLSGGLPSEMAISLLTELNRRANPWRTTFSFGRALWMDPLQIWSGDDAKISAARQQLHELAAQAAAAV